MRVDLNEDGPLLTTNFHRFHLTQFWLDFFVFFVDVQLDEQIGFKTQWC